MTETIYRVNVNMCFYIKGIDGYSIKALAEHQIETNIKLNKGIKIEKAELPDDLKEYYFGTLI